MKQEAIKNLFEKWIWSFAGTVLLEKVVRLIDHVLNILIFSISF